MSWLGDLLGFKKVKLPPVPDPMAIPRVDEDTMEQQMLKVRRRSGLERTFVTGALRPSGQRTLLGGYLK